MQYHDYYKLLGVNANANEQEIKRAYRDLARRYHPDLNPAPDAAERFKEINEAYEVLSDPEKRAHYDRIASNYQAWQQQRGRRTQRSDYDWERWTRQPPDPRRTQVDEEPSSPDDGANGGGGGLFSDFFRSIFGEGNRRANESAFANKQPIPGRDQELDITISLEDAYHGTTQQIDRPGGRTFTARVPRGARSGTKVRFEGQGEPGFAGGKPGALFLNIQIAEHPRYERRDDDLYIDINLPLYVAVLGGEVRISTLAGDVRLRVPPETQSGKLIRLAGRGMPRLRDHEQTGDLFARVMVTIPRDLAPEERELFEQLASLRPHWTSET